MKNKRLIFALAAMLPAGWTCNAAPRFDNVLIQMVPPGSTALMGLRMGEIRQTDVFRQLLTTRAFDSLDRFARQTGFDPRRDVRELLIINSPKGYVVTARGTFQPMTDAHFAGKPVRHGEYTIQTQDQSGYCILDSTLAVAGTVAGIQAVLDEWKSGKHTAAQPLTARAVNVVPSSQFWGVFPDAITFADANPLPPMAGGIDPSALLKGLRDFWFQGDLSSGLRIEAHGVESTEKLAINFRDAVRGFAGLGRLQVPENQPDLLRAFDGITADQLGTAVTMRVDIPQDLVAKLMQMVTRR